MSAAQILFAWVWSDKSGVQAADFQDQRGAGGGLVRYPGLGIKPQPIQTSRELLNISSIKLDQRCLCFLPGQLVIPPKPSLIPAPLLPSPVPSSQTFPPPKMRAPALCFRLCLGEIAGLLQVMLWDWSKWRPELPSVSALLGWNAPFSNPGNEGQYPDPAAWFLNCLLD